VLIPAVTVLVCTYSEIALKGKNRPLFQRRLLNAMRRALSGEPISNINHVESRFLVRLDDPARAEACLEKLKRVFGIRWIAPAVAVERGESVEDDLRRVSAVASAMAVRDVGDGRTFKVNTRRSDRNYGVNSQVISREVGHHVGAALDLPANMTKPDFTVFVRVLREAIMVFTVNQPGQGGLPAGSGGRVCCLLSGGIDSPVAAWMLMRRGCRPVFVHFHTGRNYQESDPGKMIELARILAAWSPTPLTMWMVPVVPFEMRAMEHVPESHDMVMFRRFMFRAGQALARREHCLALVAGDSLGQVASQTLPNLAAIGTDLELPVFRPLIGLDKEFITGFSRQIGAFDTSIQPYRDCCSIRSPRPVLNARPDDILRYSEAMDLPGAVMEALETATKLVVGPEGVQRTVLPKRTEPEAG